MDIGVDDIRVWHKARGWRDVGYHYVIRRDGALEKGRDLNVIGSHAKGQNRYSIGICFIGGKEGKGCPASNFTTEQYQIGKMLVQELAKKYNASVHGHNEFSNKQCPVLNVNDLI